jgi:nicotinic acid mononucleotide adenylyltransferase
VAPRDGGPLPGLGAIVLEMAPIDLSSTDVRAELARGAGEGDVTPAVLALIRREGLYAEAP